MFNHILVPLDGSELAECVLPHVRIMADATGAAVTLFHSLERLDSSDLYPLNPLDWHMRRAEAKLYLEKIAGNLKENLSEVNSVLVEGPAAESVIEYSHSNDVDFLILSSHGRSGLSGWNISSVVQKIVLRSYTSMLLVRAYGTPSTVTGYERIMVALDCSNRAESSVPTGIMLASANSSDLLLAHVLKAPEMPRRLPPSSDDIKLSEVLMERNHSVAEQYLKELTEQLASERVLPTTRLITGRNVAATLEKLVKGEGIDLVILSAHGYEGDSNWPYGSVAVSFIAYGSTPLLVMQDIPFSRARRTSAEQAAGESSGH